MSAKYRNLIIAGSAALLLLAFFTNPDQAAHLTAIQKIVRLRQPPQAALDWNNALMPLLHYDNYWIFSATSLGNTTLTWGYFGQVQTTDGIEILFRPKKTE